MANRKTRHHIVPKSVGGSNDATNIAQVERVLHERYHTLFSNKTPSQIIRYLVETFWNGNWSYVQEALEASEQRRKYYGDT